MEYAYYRERINEDAIGKYDVTPVFADGAALSNLVADLLAPVDVGECTHVAGIEALGFVLGGAAAAQSGLGFVPVRKTGNLPLPDNEIRRRTVTDYSGTEKTLELSTHLLGPGERVLLVDDWVETGAQMRAAASLVEDSGASVAAVSVLRAERNEESAALFDRYAVHSIG
jgi:adenine phosphoribosyltransferase